MCGRFSLSIAEKNVLMERYSLKKIDFEVSSRPEIFPSQKVAIIRNDNPDVLIEAMWGLMPEWSKRQIINARAESIAVKPTFKELFRSKRCLIPADAFYEWDSGKKKHKITLGGEIFSFAGIYDSAVSCAIITTEPNSVLNKIHNRMPVVLKRTDETKYLQSPEEAVKLLVPSSDNFKVD